MNILDKILKEKEFEVENLKKSYPLKQLQSGIIEKKYDVRSLYNALNNNNTKINTNSNFNILYVSNAAAITLFAIRELL